LLRVKVNSNGPLGTLLTGQLRDDPTTVSEALKDGGQWSVSQSHNTCMHIQYKNIQTQVIKENSRDTYMA